MRAIRIIGIDPGLRRTGWGIIDCDGPRLVYVACGSVVSDETAALGVRLRQLFDGLQTVATGALRGAGDTRTPMLCHFTAYWIIGLPLGAWLCFRRGWGAFGLWAGLSLALILIGIVLLRAWRRTVSRLMAETKAPELQPANL